MALIARKTNLLIQEMEEDVCVYDQSSKQCHVLNKMASRVWRLCDGSSTPAQIAARLDTDMDVVLLALKDLRAKELVEGDELVLTDGPSVSRRGLMKKLSAAAALAPVVLPLIQTVVAPTPAMAASFRNYT